MDVVLDVFSEACQMIVSSFGVEDAFVFLLRTCLIKLFFLPESFRVFDVFFPDDECFMRVFLLERLTAAAAAAATAAS